MSLAFDPPHRPNSDEDASFASNEFDATHADANDRWLDEALRTVPLPAGFLSRMADLTRDASPTTTGKKGVRDLLPERPSRVLRTKGS